MNRLVSRALVAATVVAGSAAFVLFAAQPPQQKPPDPQRPVFRAGAYFVTVDVYPLQDGRVVDGLAAEDFQILEDGKPQKVESFEYVQIGPAIHENNRDPNNQGEMLQRLADPRSRVFVLFLDSYHLAFHDAAQLREPIVQTIDDMFAPSDLFAVMTPLSDAQRLAFGRKMVTVADDIQREWPVDVIDQKQYDVEEQKIVDCYGPGVPVGLIIAKRREDRVLTSLEELVSYLGAVREGRKTVFIFTQGWMLYPRSPEITNAIANLGPVATPPIGITSTGQPRLGTRLQDGTWFACDAEARRIADLENDRRFRDLLQTAAAANVAFYPVEPVGVGAPLRRTQQLQSLASETNGAALVNTNDLSGGMKRLASGLSSYYLLGYSSTNTTFDGRVRRISVKVARPGVAVNARRMHRAPTAKDLEALRNISAPTPADPSTTGIDDALGALGRLRAASPLYAAGRALANEVVVVAELSASELAAGRWKQGGEVEARVSSSKGEAVGSGRGRILPGGRSVAIAIPFKAAGGPIDASVRARSETEGSAEAQTIIPPPSGTLVGNPLVFRAVRPGAFQPAAALEFQRSERLRVEWPIAGALDRREARLLDRTGQPLPIPLTLTETQSVTGPALAVDLTLAPLAVSDYVIELVAEAGGKTDRKLFAFRIGR